MAKGRFSISLKASELLSAIKKLSGLLDKRGTIMILECLLMEARENEIIVSATDLDAWMSITIKNVDVISEGVVAMPGHALIALISRCGDAKVDIDQMEKRMQIKAHGAKYALPFYPSEEWPSLPEKFKAGQCKITVRSDAFLSAISFCSPCIIDDSSKPNLSGLHISNPSEGKIKFEGANGHVLSRIVIPGSATGLVPKNGILLTRSAFTAIPQIIRDDEGDITFSLAENSFGIQTDTVSLYSKVVDANFPNTDAYIPMDLTDCAVIPRASIVNAVARLSAVERERTRRTLLSFANGLSLSKNSEGFEGEENITLNQKPGFTNEFAFNGYYLDFALSAFTEDEICFFGGVKARSACVFKANNLPLKDDATKIVVMMPMS